MASVDNIVARVFGRDSKFYSLFRFLVGFNAVKYLLKHFYTPHYSRWKKDNDAKWKSLLKNSEQIPESVNGIIQITLSNVINSNNSNSNRENNSLHHRHVWVNGPDYNGMEDNDLRGFLDGRYKNAWNQPGQIHVRLGRHRTSYKHGEGELFRVLQRWENINLPENTIISGCRLELEVEVGVDHDLEVLLYNVHKDWNPGKGGVNRNNNSAPAYGEVWWNEVGHDIETWGLPGVGFASDSHAEADTPVTPLARVHYHSGDSRIVFKSEELTSYIENRIHNGEPLLFLLKLSDYFEDLPDTFISLYSGNHGDSQNTARRPKLTVDWKSSNAKTEFKREILLEHGRSLELPPMEFDKAKNLAISFLNKNYQESPVISVRGGREDTLSDWQSIYYPMDINDWSRLEVRISAYQNPLKIGNEFTAELRDTWVITGPPEEQKVLWTFHSPSNQIHTVYAKYIGDSCWQVEFKPDEIGRWKYYWSQNFTKETYESAKGIFDVIAGDRENALKALENLIEKIHSSNIANRIIRVEAFGPAFNRIQRELMRFESAESFNLKNNIKIDGAAGELLDIAREALTGEKSINE